MACAAALTARCTAASGSCSGARNSPIAGVTHAVVIVLVLVALGLWLEYRYFRPLGKAGSWAMAAQYARKGCQLGRSSSCSARSVYETNLGKFGDQSGARLGALARAVAESGRGPARRAFAGRGVALAGRRPQSCGGRGAG